MKGDVLRIGLIVRPQGIKGEMKIRPLTNDVNRYSNLNQVIIEQNGTYTDAKITVNRFDQNAVYAYLEGYYTREAVGKMKNAYICVAREDAVVLPNDSWFIADLIGLAVNADQKKLGTLREVIQTGGVDVYDVERADGTHILFPALKRVVRSVDVDQGIMELDEEALSEVCVDED